MSMQIAQKTLLGSFNFCYAACISFYFFSYYTIKVLYEWNGGMKKNISIILEKFIVITFELVVSDP